MRGATRRARSQQSATDPQMARQMAEAVAGLDPPAEDRAAVRKAILALLASATDPHIACRLADTIARKARPELL